MNPNTQGGPAEQPSYGQIPVDNSPPASSKKKGLIIGAIVTATLALAIVVVLLVGRSTTNQSIDVSNLEPTVDGTLETASNPAELIASSQQLLEDAASLTTDRSLIRININQESDEESNASLIEEFETAIENGELTPDDIPPLRYAGTNRYATAAAVSRRVFADATKVKRVVIVNGDSDIDKALASAYANTETSILLVEQNRVSNETSTELQRIGSASGTPEFILIGGEAVISEYVRDLAHEYLSASNNKTRRVAGASRYETAVAISQDHYPGEFPDVNIAYIAAADSYADIMLATNATVSPVLLVDRTSSPEVTGEELCRLGAEHVIVVGGSAAIDTAALEQASFQYRRAAGGACSDTTPNFYKYKDLLTLNGDSRLETAVAVSKRNYANHGGSAIIVNGYSAPDILTATVLSQSQGGLPILYVNNDSYSPATVQELKRLAALQLFVIGGESAVSERIMTNMRCEQFGGCTGFSAGPTGFND